MENAGKLLLKACLEAVLAYSTIAIDLAGAAAVS